jgi:cytochrome c oxidase subunit 2
MNILPASMSHAASILLPLMNAFWLPEEGSTTAGEVDWIFNFILAISVFFFALIVILTVYFLLRYRRRAGVEAEKTAHGSVPLELTWTVIPTILVIVIFYFGFTGYMDMKVAPEGAYEIQVTGQKWQWFFTYPNGHVEGNLHVPVDEPVKLVMTSEDVIHSLYIPAFRTKMDLVPGRYTTTWFEATKPGTYVLFCAEYCGTGHSDMGALVIVHPPGEFEAWLADAGNIVDRMSPSQAGELLYNTRGCKQCHSIDGSAGIGPTFKGVFGHSYPMKDGEQVTADENYIRESILDPQAKIVAGFDPVMPTYKGKLKDNEITAIIEFIKTLKE